MTICQGCASDIKLRAENDGEIERCENCPPWTCRSCGQTDSMAKPCKCWRQLDLIADTKEYFAGAGFDLSSPREVTPNGA